MITAAVNGIGGQGVRPVRQTCRDLERPVACRIDLRHPDLNILTVDKDFGAQLPRPGDLRGAVVGYCPARNGAEKGRDVIHHVGNNWRGRRRGVVGFYRTGLAGVIRLIGGGKTQDLTVEPGGCQSKGEAA